MAGPYASVEEAEFVKQLLTIDFGDFFCKMETLKLYGALKNKNDDVIADAVITRRSSIRKPEPLPSGKDLVGIGVKHYGLSELPKFLDRTLCISKIPNGHLYKGVVAGQKSVLVKFWSFDSFISRESRYIHHPARLYNEIYVLKEKLKSDPNLPNLIGYSIDKMLAAVYDVAPEFSLAHSRQSDKLLWQDRMRAAIRVAKALQSLHKLGIKVGCIDPRAIILDKNMNAYLCHFGLCPDVKEEFGDDYVKLGLFDGNFRNYGPPELTGKGEWSLETDIYSFGVLLYDLISKEKMDKYDHLPRGLSKDSLVNVSFFDDVVETTRYRISKLVMDCTQDEMSDRPKIASVIETLSGFLTDDTLIPPAKKSKHAEM